MKELLRNMLPIRTNSIVIVLALFGLLGCSQLAMAEDPVYFADADLKAAVEIELGISDPTPTDMLVLTVLEAYESEISDLTGIEYASNLMELHLPGNQISDTSPLSELTSLEHLNLNYNQISDISPLSELTGLWDLQLTNNQINDISPLSELTNLTWLYLLFNQITDISALSGLTSLTVLFIWDNPLNVEAYCTYLRLIQNNNPGISLSYDRNPYPPGSCCEADFDCDGDVDGTDATTFKLHFGRNLLFNPCDEINPCHGDFDCDQDCDGNDAALFKEDFGRNESSNPCPVCEVIDWCGY